MQPTGLTTAAASALASAPAVLDMAEGSRWRAPEITAALAEHAARLARDSHDSATATLAEGWLLQGLAAVGRGVPAVPRAVAALTEATRAHHVPASDRLRVALAGVARSLDDRGTALVLLAPVLTRTDAPARVRADAHLEAALCRDERSGADGGQQVEVAVAALRQLGGEYGELGLAAVEAALAAQQRALRQLGAAVEHARAGLRRILGERAEGGVLQPVSPYLAATLGLELALALLDQGQHDAAQEVARSVLRWDAQPGALVSIARLRLALAHRVYLPSGARDEALSAAEWVAAAVDQRDLPELEVECHGLLAELRERGGELSEALAASRRAHGAYRALASSVERALVLLVRAAGEVAPLGDGELEGASRMPTPAGPGSPSQRTVWPEHEGVNGSAAWMTGAGQVWQPSVQAPRHPASVTPRRPTIGTTGSGAAATPGLDSTDPLLRRSAGGSSREPAPSPSEITAPGLRTSDGLTSSAPSTERDALFAPDSRGAVDPLGGPGSLASHNQQGATDPLGLVDPLGDHDRRGTSDPLNGRDPLGGYDRPGAGDSLSGRDPLGGYDRSGAGVPFDGRDPLGESDPLGGREPLGTVDPLTGRAPHGPGLGALGAPGPFHPADPFGGSNALGADPLSGAADQLPGGSLSGDPLGAAGSSMLGSPSMSDAPAGLSVAELAVELLGITDAAGRPPHLVLIDVATPDGSASGPSVTALARSIASRVYDQLPTSGRLYLLEHDAVAVALPETDSQAVTRWVRTVSTGLSLRWPELAAELPRAAFRIDVRRLDEDRTLAEQLWDLRVDRAARTGEAAGPPDEGGAPPPTGRHLAGSPESPPVAPDPVANWINARPGSGGRRRRPDGEGGYPGAPATQDEWGTPRQGAPGGRSVGPLTSNYQNGASGLLGGRMLGDPPGFEAAGFSTAPSRLAVVEPPPAAPMPARADPARTTLTGAEPPPVAWARNGQAAGRHPAGANGHAGDLTAGTNGHAAERAGGMNGYAVERAVGANGHAAERTARINGHAVEQAAGTNGHAAERAAGTNGYAVERDAGANGHAAERAAGTNGHAVERSAGTNGYAVERAGGTNGHAVERAAGTNGHTGERADCADGHAAEPGEGHDAEPDGGEAPRNGRRGPRTRGQASARPSDSTPLSELSFAELLAGALAAYRES